METLAETPAQYPINKANARAMARLKWDKYYAEQAAPEPIPAQLPALQQPAKQEQLHATIIEQIADIDKDWKKAKAIDRTRLAQAKATLYALLFPKPRPSRKDRVEAPQA